MSQRNWEIVTKHHCQLGEGPVWDKKGKRIFWIDILKGEIRYYYPDSYENNKINTGRLLGSVALRKSGGLIAAVKDGFATIDPDNGDFQFVKMVEAHLPDNRFNDGKCDPAGRFWAGTMSVLDTPHAGSLYMLEKDFALVTKISGVGCSNGLAWSSDHSILYYIDTHTRNIVAYQYDVTSGGISHPRVIISIPKTSGYPDGMTIDAEGMLWVALWDGWKIVRYNPGTGRQLQQICLPVSRVTSCVFGGDTLEDLYITSAKAGLSEKDLMEQPLAGSLFIIKNVGFRGMDAFEFNG